MAEEEQPFSLFPIEKSLMWLFVLFLVIDIDWAWFAVSFALSSILRFPFLPSIPSLVLCSAAPIVPVVCPFVHSIAGQLCALLTVTTLCLAVRAEDHYILRS